MHFQPLHRDHAISEVVVQVVLDRIVSNADVERMTALYDSSWSAELPAKQTRFLGNIRLAQGGFQSQQEFTVEMDPDSVDTAPGRAEFKSVKASGSTDWRILAEGNSLTFNCGTYSRWSKIWARMEQYLRGCCSALPNARVLAASLAYVDIFLWDGDSSDYDITELLVVGSDHVPSVIARSGFFWHSHVGYFVDPASTAFHVESLRKGRLLKRMHAEGVQRTNLPHILTEGNSRQPVVKLDGLVRLDLESPMQAPEFGLAQSSTMYEFLHSVHKDFFGVFLTKAAATQIGLAEA